MPTGHEEQEVELVLPVDGLYVPTGQEEQAVELVLPVDGLYVPTGQTVQEDCPVRALYLPAEQERHDP